jgi:hypothetical protein
MLAVVFLASAAGNVARAQNGTVAPSSGNLRINSATGMYSITFSSPAWTFRGSVDSKIRDVKHASGSNNLGTFEQLTFSWGQPPHAVTGMLQWYAQSNILLAGVTSGSAQSPFPYFTDIPKHLRVLSFKNAVFAGPEFHAQRNAMPWILFNKSAQTAVISPASEFLISRLAGNAKTSIGAGINPLASATTAARTRWTMLIVGHGIQPTLMKWGRAMDTHYRRPRTGNEANVVLRDFGYWTDNGAFYYYNYLPKLGYTGTLVAVARQFRAHRIPLAYMELDSWWYRKTDRYVNGSILKAKAGKFPSGRWNIYGGTWQYRASHQLFPHGLAAFQKELGVPLVCHGRWIDPHSPYHKQYAISGVAPVDPAWWRSTANYFARSGVIGYEQDWLNYIYQYSPAMQVSQRIGNAFTGNMSQSLADHGMSLIYCMPLPRFFLQSAQTPDVSMIRCANDYFIQPRWTHFLYTSSLAHAMGLWPWTDTLMSGNTGDILLATLSAGPVGVGDQMGRESWHNIRKVIRSDGRIVKPDAPLLPTDQTILADAAGKHRPLVASTTSDQGIKTTYLFIYRRKADHAAVHISSSELKLPSDGRYVVYNYFTHTVRHLSARQVLSVRLQPGHWQYDIVAPETTSGMAILGDLHQFVPMGRQRIAGVGVQHGVMTLTAILAQGEHSVTIAGYSKHGVSASIDGGSVATTANGQTGLFTVKITPGIDAPVYTSHLKRVVKIQVRIAER